MRRVARRSSCASRTAALVFSDEGKAGERDRSFDLTELEADDDFELELSSGSLVSRLL